MKQVTGKDLKDRGMQRAIDHAGEYWKHAAMQAVARWKAKARSEKLYAFEDIKQHCLDNGLPPPPHVNAWGAIARKAVSDELIAPTGHYRLAKNVAAHSRVVRLYKVVRKSRNK